MTKQTETAILQYIDSLIDNSAPDQPVWNIEKIRSGEKNRWNYIDGCMITAVLSLYEITKDEKYLAFADDFVGYFIEENGNIRTYDGQDMNLDDINAGRNLFPLYDLTGKEKYRKAMETLREQLRHQPRTKAGNFWHKKIYPYQVWLDGLYMAQPFYMQYETRYNKMEGCRDSFLQFQRVRELMRDPVTGLYYHGYDESRKMYWADKKSGCSANFWLRAIGWFCCALVETASVMDESLYYEYRFLQSMLKELAEALIGWQDESGMFFQVVDRSDYPGNYPETSGTALIAYVLLKGVRLKYLPERFYAPGARAMEGITERYLKTGADNKLSLGGICLVAGLGGVTHRDGSIEYYLSEPVVENEAKGTAPFLLAFTELLRSGRNS